MAKVKKTALLILAVMAFGCAAAGFAQTSTPQAAPGAAGVLDLPSYPESRLEVEMDVSDENILPMFKDLFMSVLELGQEGVKSFAASPDAAKMMGPMAGFGDILQDVDMVEALKALVEPIEQVKFQLHSLNSTDTKQTVQKIGDFYKGEFAKRGWKRIFLVNEDGSGELVMGYALKDRGGLAFLVVDAGQSKTEIISFGMKGLPDLAKMFRTLKPVLGMMMEKMPIGMMMGTMAPPGAPPQVERIEKVEEVGE